MKQGLILLTILGLSVTAHAGNIVFTVSGTLALESGTDSSGLDGATFTYTATFLDTANYYDWGGVPLDRYAVTDSVVGTSSVTISGTATNDGTYSTGTAVFAPKYFSSTPNYPEASYIAATSGPPPDPLSFTLNDAETFSFQLMLTASASALAVQRLDGVNISDFEGSTPVFYSAVTADPGTNWIEIGSGFYSLANGTVAVPEGKYISLAFGIFCLGFVGYRRYRRQA